jgi:hypothetical protein
LSITFITSELINSEWEQAREPNSSKVDGEKDFIVFRHYPSRNKERHAAFSIHKFEFLTHIFGMVLPPSCNNHNNKKIIVQHNNNINMSENGYIYFNKKNEDLVKTGRGLGTSDVGVNATTHVS